MKVLKSDVGSDKARPEMGAGEKSIDGELGEILSARENLGTLAICAFPVGKDLDLLKALKTK